MQLQLDFHSHCLCFCLILALQLIEKMALSDVLAAMQLAQSVIQLLGMPYPVCAADLARDK